jgi:hypothetical protein
LKMRLKNYFSKRKDSLRWILKLFNVVIITLSIDW